MHIPSFVVGSIASGSLFLAVHQQASYRSRLSYRWPLAGECYSIKNVGWLVG
jgi:hypothetical protein